VREGGPCAALMVAAATALTRLVLGGCDTGELEPWVAQLVRDAPASLRVLKLSGLWTPELAAAVGDQGQLQALILTSASEIRPLPPPGAALWSSLRALWLDQRCGDSQPVPEVRQDGALQSSEAFSGCSEATLELSA
jgi:hypothetical protein